MLARRALAQAGFDSVQVVEAQAAADPDFSTVNLRAESQVAHTYLLKNSGCKVSADVLVATEARTDRVGVESSSKDGSYLQPFREPNQCHHG